MDIHLHRPILYPKQYAAIYEPKRFSLIEASVKSGKTSGCIAWLTEHAFSGREGWNYWWVAPVSEQARIAFDRTRRALGPDHCRAYQSPYRIALPQGSVIWFKSGDKPDCYDEVTEILTRRGWVRFPALSAEDVVLTRSKRGEAQWQAPTRIISQPYAGEMVAIEHKRLDLCVTPNHRMLVERGGRELIVAAETLKNKNTIPAWCTWRGADIEKWSDDECALLGFYLAEGSAIGNASSDPERLTKRCGYRIHLAQTKGPKGGDKGNVRQQLLVLLSRLGLKWTERRDGILLWSKSRWNDLILLGNKYTKYVPLEAKNFPPEKLKILLRWMVLGDGTSRRGEQWTYFTVSKRLADDVQEIALKCGWNATIKERAPMPYGRPGATASNATGYIVKIQKQGRSHYLRGKQSYISRTAYAGMVYCVSAPNGIVMVRRNGKPSWSGNSLYGEDVHAAVIDEASRLKQDAWFALRSTLTKTRGPARIIGNVHGRSGWFYRMARQAEQGFPDMAYHKMIAHDAVEAGVLAADEIEAARRELPDHVFRELYLAEASEDGGNPFGFDAIRRCTVPTMYQGTPVVYGIDLAKSVDWTVVVGMTSAGYVCRFERWQHVPWEDTVNRILAIIGNTPTLVDSTGVGDPIVEALQRRTHGHPGLDNNQVEGYQFSQRSKQQLMEGLALAIQSGGVTFPAGPITMELEQFTYEMRGREGRFTGVAYSAPAGYHDDSVMALALAEMHRHKAQRPMVVPVGLVASIRAQRPSMRHMR